MTRRRLLLVLLLAAVGGWLALLAAEHYFAEGPNYSRIEDGLYLGGRVAAPPPGTTAVINLNESDDPYRVEVHIWVPIRDAEPVPSLDWLRKIVDHIDANHRAGRTVYVHCQNGVSRSGMAIVAYEMAKNRWSLDEAMAFVRERRPGLRPNPAFMVLLKDWEGEQRH